MRETVRESQIEFYEARLAALKSRQPVSIADRLREAEAKASEAARIVRCRNLDFEMAVATLSFRQSTISSLETTLAVASLSQNERTSRMAVIRTNLVSAESAVKSARQALIDAQEKERRLQSEAAGLRTEIEGQTAQHPAFLEALKKQAQLARAGIAAAESVWHARAIDLVDAIAKVSEIVNREVEVVAIANVQLRSAGLPESMQPYLSSLLALGTPRMLAESLAAFPPDYQRARAFLDKLTEDAASLAQ